MWENVKGLLDKISSYYSVVIDKGGCHENCFCHIFRYILSGPNSTFKHFINITKDECDTGIDIE